MGDLKNLLAFNWIALGRSVSLGSLYDLERGP